MRKVVPDGFDAVMPVEPSAALICEITEAMPPEKSTPTTLSLGLAVAVFDKGSADGSSTRIRVSWRCVLVAVSV